MDKPSLALCVEVGDNTERFTELARSIQPFVDKLVLHVTSGFEDAISKNRDLADVVISGPANPQEIVRAADTDFVLLMHADETLEHPERLRDIVARDFDITCFPRRNWISGYLSKHFGQHNLQPRLFKCLADPNTFEGNLTRYNAFECWLDRHLQIENIRKWAEQIEAKKHQNADANKKAEGAGRFLADAESEHARRTARGGNIRILLTHFQGGFGDLLMVTPAIREIRRRYPEAEITCRAEKAGSLGFGKRVNKNLHRCLHPAVDYIDTTPYSEDENNALDNTDFDLVFDWAGAIVNYNGTITNGYELDAAWVGFEPADSNYNPDWTIAKGDEDFGRKWFRKYCKTKRCIGVVLTSGSSWRTWPYTEDLVNALLKRYPDITILLFGYGDSQMMGLRYMRRLFGVRSTLVRTLQEVEESQLPKWHDPKRVINCTFINLSKDWKSIVSKRRSLDLHQQAAVYPHLDLLVTPDSGPLHIAAALKVPTVACFGTVPPELRIKHFPWITAIKSDYPCSPCYFESNCPDIEVLDGPPCLKSISVEMMMEEIERRLAHPFGS